MAYNLTLVQMTQPPNNFSSVAMQQSGLGGFPAVPFNYLLFSMWICLGNSPGSIDVDNDISFFAIAANSNSVLVVLNEGLTHTFNGEFTAQTPFIDNYRCNVLVSADPTTETIQVYLNDTECTLQSGGWISSGPFNIDDFPLTLVLGAGGEGGPTPAVGDIYINAPLAFYDLSVVGNRRAFINADLTPVDLGGGGAGPTGSQPPIFLSCRTGVANDMVTNYGFGGSFAIPYFGNLVLQPGGVCLIPVAPGIPLTGVSATAEVGTLTVDINAAILQLVSLYPIAPTASEYAFESSSGGDFPSSFSQFSFAAWICKSVNIQLPNGFGAPSLQMALSPSAITISANDGDGNVLFSGTWTNPGTSNNEYQVLFSLDTVAQIYTLYVTNELWTPGSVTFPNVGAISNVGA
jgi:hypothetical protein